MLVSSSLLSLCHAFIRDNCASGVFLDATAGNGYDTEFLRQRGVTLSCDCQTAALDSTLRRLALSPQRNFLCDSADSVPTAASSASTLTSISFDVAFAQPSAAELRSLHSLPEFYAACENTLLFHVNHAEYGYFIPKIPLLDAALFNLGFLPGSDKHIRTTASTTLCALNAVWRHLQKNAVLSVHCYTGHAGAAEEYAAVAAWMQKLPYADARVTACQQYNKEKNAETLFLVQKIASPFS